MHSFNHKEPIRQSVFYRIQMDRSTNRIARRLSKKDSEPSDQFPKDFERIFNESER